MNHSLPQSPLYLSARELGAVVEYERRCRIPAQQTVFPAAEEGPLLRRAPPLEGQREYSPTERTLISRTALASGAQARALNTGG